MMAEGRMRTPGRRARTERSAGRAAALGELAGGSADAHGAGGEQDVIDAGTPNGAAGGGERADGSTFGPNARAAENDGRQIATDAVVARPSVEAVAPEHATGQADAQSAQGGSYERAGAGAAPRAVEAAAPRREPADTPADPDEWVSGDPYMGVPSRTFNMRLLDPLHNRYASLTRRLADQGVQTSTTELVTALMHYGPEDPAQARKLLAKWRNLRSEV